MLGFALRLNGPSFLLGVMTPGFSLWAATSRTLTLLALAKSRSMPSWATATLRGWRVEDEAVEPVEALEECRLTSFLGNGGVGGAFMEGEDAVTELGDVAGFGVAFEIGDIVAFSVSSFV